MECCIQRASDILDRDPVRFFAEDVNFHNIICEASGNQLAPILGKTLHNLVGEPASTTGIPPDSWPCAIRVSVSTG